MNKTTTFLFLLAFVFALYFCSFSVGYCASDAVDTFTRTNSNTCGSTEAVTAYRWTEVGEDSTDTVITIANSSLSFNYTTGGNAYLSTNVGGFDVADVDISLVVTPLTNTLLYGIGYRMPAQDSVFGAPTGYYAMVDASANYTSLYYGTARLAYSTVSIGSSNTLRLLAKGSSHKIYWNGVLTLTSTDSSNLGAGYAGISTYESAIACSSFTVNPIDSDGVDSYKISDNFMRANSNIVGEMTLSSYPWVEVNDTSGSAISINSDAMMFQQNSGKNLNLACNIRGLYATNVDVSTTVEITNSTNGASYGIGYRLPTLAATYQASGGYYVTLKSTTKTNTLTLYKGTTSLKSANISIPLNSYVPLRILAYGGTHKVFFNGALTLTYTDTSSPAKGYVGLFASKSTASFDNFQAGTFTSPTPFGSDFALGGYSLTDYPDFNYSYMEMTADRKFGWNMANGQDFWQGTLDSLNNSAATDSHTMIATMDMSLNDIPSSGGEKYTPDSYIQQQIQYSVGSVNSDFIGWYAYPEELDPTDPTQLQKLEDCRSLCTEYGCGLPTYMYMAGADWASYDALIVPYIDVVPASAYTTYQGEPIAWVRWRNEETLSAITSAGATVGSNYGAGQKTPVTVCELDWEPGTIWDGTTQKLDTPQMVYHDFYQSIVSGARGIIVWDVLLATDPNYLTDGNSPDEPQLRRVWDAYCRAASEIMGPEQLGTVILSGTDKTSSLTLSITSGPATTCDFRYPTANGRVWYGDNHGSLYPAVQIIAKAWSGNTYVIGVDSYDPTDSNPIDPNNTRNNPTNTGPTVVTISGLPNTGTAKVLFEGRTVPISSGTITDSFASQAGGSVHIYKISGTN
jgi:hypothetical protein